MNACLLDASSALWAAAASKAALLAAAFACLAASCCSASASCMSSHFWVAPPCDTHRMNCGLHNSYYYQHFYLYSGYSYDGTAQLMVIWVCAELVLPPRMVSLDPGRVCLGYSLGFRISGFCCCYMPGWLLLLLLHTCQIFCCNGLLLLTFLLRFLAVAVVMSCHCYATVARY